MIYKKAAVPYETFSLQSLISQSSKRILQSQQFSRSYNNSSSGANLTPYSGVILTPKRTLKNSFSGVKVTPDMEELKKPQKRSYPVPKIFTPLSELN